MNQPSLRDQRIRDLYRMNKGQLAAIVRGRRNIVWTAAPLERWSKDELINEVLSAEFSQSADGTFVAVSA